MCRLHEQPARFMDFQNVEGGVWGSPKGRKRSKKSPVGVGIFISPQRDSKIAPRSMERKRPGKVRSISIVGRLAPVGLKRRRETHQTNVSERSEKMGVATAVFAPFVQLVRALLTEHSLPLQMPLVISVVKLLRRPGEKLRTVIYYSMIPGRRARCAEP